jgi:hypothetical protein
MNYHHYSLIYLLQYTIRGIKENHEGQKLKRLHQLLFYADDYAKN